jgi:hypothetical protein
MDSSIRTFASCGGSFGSTGESVLGGCHFHPSGLAATKISRHLSSLSFLAYCPP